MSANDSQVGGSHYQSKYQHWDFVHDCLGGLYLEGCLTKYVSRWHKKNGLQDLQKAKHYLTKLKEMAVGDDFCGGVPFKMDDVERFCKDNNLGTKERFIIVRTAAWLNMADLEEIEVMLDELIQNAQDFQARAHHV